MRILALADDLTGALETGAKFAAACIPSLVTTELSLSPAGLAERFEVLVIDTETRHVDSAAAAGLVRSLAFEARRKSVNLVYKKTDSTLRGNIGSELGALLEAYSGAPLFYVPAYPETGRTVREGVLLVQGVPVSGTTFGKDPLNPVATSFIPDALAQGCRMPVRHGVRQERPIEVAVYVYDGECNADIAVVARVLLEMPGVKLAAGPAAFAAEIAALLSPGGEPDLGWPVIDHCLVVNGSLHAASLGQVRHAVENGWRSVAAGASVSGWAVLDTEECAAAGTGLEIAARIGQAVRDTVRQARLEALVIFGGDTAWGVLSALGFPALEPLGEVMPGVPVSRFEVGGRPLHLITKAGGFGTPYLLDRLRAKLCRS
jgi:uncharacterized protein YgbK (DUF1537 family)